MVALVGAFSVIVQLLRLIVCSTTCNCFRRDRGKTWQLAEEGSNQYKEVELFSRDTAEFYFKQLIKPPASTLACLDFRFKKYSSGMVYRFLFLLQVSI